MNILISQYSLRERGGSALFVVEVACALAARGDRVALYASHAGEFGDRLARAGVTFIDDPRKCPWVPDVIHGQHRRFALDCLLAFPDTPALLYCHGLVPWKERPFLHPRVLCYAGTSRWLALHMTQNSGIPPERIHIIPNHIDLEKITTVRDVAPTPRRALLFSNNFFSRDDLRCLEVACGESGLELDRLGRWFGNCDPSPEKILPRYDLVFAIGRSALEAAACGCAVIPACGSMTEEMILAENYEKFRSQNFSMRQAKHETLSAGWIKAQIARWDPESLRAVTRRVRDEARLEGTVGRLAELYSRVVEEFRGLKRTPGDEADALSAFYKAEIVDARLPTYAPRAIPSGAYELRDENEDFSGLLSDARRLQREAGETLARMRASMSWKITFPLRALADAISAGRKSLQPRRTGRE